PPRPNYPVASPHVAVVGLETMNEQIGFSLRTERLVASLSGVFGGLATLLDVIGLYGVMAYVVMRRACEFGIGIALGALRSNVISNGHARGVHSHRSRPGCRSFAGAGASPI